MKARTVKIVCFSPTGTSRKVALEVAKGIGSTSPEIIDITKPAGRQGSLSVAEGELLIVCVPVYMGRVPALASDWFRKAHAFKNYAVPIVVFGNRTFGNALLELKDIIVNTGLQVIAGGAFIGEHSFSDSEHPCSPGRPDEKDLGIARDFGLQISQILPDSQALNNSKGITIPGTYPYGGVTKLWDVDFIAINSNCVKCGTCSQICPTGAISPENSSNIDIEACISCCACIKSCPQMARSKKPGPVLDATLRISTLYSQRKEPEVFL